MHMYNESAPNLQKRALCSVESAEQGNGGFGKDKSPAGRA